MAADPHRAACGTIGLACAARARPGDSTLIALPNGAHAAAAHLCPLEFAVEKTFAGTGLLVALPMFMPPGKAMQPMTLAGQIALAKRPGRG